MRKRPWPTMDLAYMGAFLGMGIGAAHNFYHLADGGTSSENPILHILVDEVAATIGVAGLLACFSGFRNWLVRASPNSDL